MRTVRTLRALAAGLVAITALVALAGTASAQTYPGGAALTLSTPTVGQGGSVTATATGYAAGADVTFTLTSDPINLGTVKANDSGVASVTFTIPSDFPTGPHTVTSTGLGPEGSTLTLHANLTVTAAGVTPAPTPAGTGTTGSSSGQLPQTGSDNTMLLRGGILLVALGGILALAARKRSNSRKPELV